MVSVTFGEVVYGGDSIHALRRPIFTWTNNTWELQEMGMGVLRNANTRIVFKFEVF